MARNTFNANGIVPAGPYSHAVKSGDFIFLSGQLPLEPKTGKLIEGDITKQTEQCFMNLFNVLKSSNLTSDNVVKVNVYLTNMNDFNTMNTVYSKQFYPPYPARTTIGVASLPLGAMIEIEMIIEVT